MSVAGTPPRLDRHPVDDVVDLLRGDARDDVRHQRVEDLGGEPAGGAHPGKAFGPVQLDRAVAAGDGVVVGEEAGFDHGADIVAAGWFDDPRGVMRRGMTDERIWTAGLLVIGDEILSGRTQDRNVAQIGTWLNLQGIRLAEVRMVPDDMARIAEAVNALRSAYDYLFTTGGIGPTHDDITVDAIAAALGVPVVVHPKARAVLEAYYAARGGLTEARLRMARVPEGAELIENRMSGAPGIRHGNIFILAGVPHIATLMLEALSGQLEGGRPLLSRTIGCWVPESEVAELLGETERAHPGCQIGSYPFFKDGRVGANFVIRSLEEGALEACAADLVRRLEADGKPVSGEI